MGKNSKLILPESKDHFLSGILTNIKKRGKSLKYNSWSISIERVFEEHERDRIEKIEFRIQPSNSNSWLEVTIWQDRFVSINCWERSKQKKWDWYHEGKLLPIYDGKKLVESIEATRDHFFEMNDAKTSIFAPIWEPLLASGLKLV